MSAAVKTTTTLGGSAPRIRETLAKKTKRDKIRYAMQHYGGHELYRVLER